MDEWEAVLNEELDLRLRNCGLQEYKHRADLPTFELADEVIAYASPDSTYSVTRDLFRSAERSILIGIYDFSARHITDLIAEALDKKPKVEVTLMLDVLGKKEEKTFDDLIDMGCYGVPAPSCANDNREARYFRSSHEKVIVIDGTWTMVQSGNYSDNSCPKNEIDGDTGPKFRTGNRDMGIAIRSKKVASFFTKVLKSDIKLHEKAGGLRAAPTERSATVQVDAPVERPKQRFASLRFRPETPIKATPILSPENYVPEVSRVLASAKKSIWIEQQYILTHQAAIQGLLSKIDPELDVRIILAVGIHSGKKQRAKAMADLDKVYGLRPGTNVRVLNPRRFVHCHNKLIIVDGKTVLLSSQNWSNYAVLDNREAGMLLESPRLAEYYGEIFLSDWEDAVTTVRRPKGARRIRADTSDYAPV